MLHWRSIELNYFSDGRVGHIGVTVIGVATTSHEKSSDALSWQLRL